MSFGRLRFGKLEELRAAFECNSDSEFAKTPAFSTAEALTQHLQRISFQHGFSVVKKNTHQTKIVYVCKFAGHYKDHDPKRTAAAALKAACTGSDGDSGSITPPPTVLKKAAVIDQPRRMKQRRSQKCGCTWTATAKLIDGMWNLTRLHDHHRGHKLVPGLLLPEHRRLTRVAMDDLVTWKLSGVPTALIIERIRDKYKVTLSSVDVHNKLRGKLDKVKRKVMAKQEQQEIGLSPTPSTSVASTQSREPSMEVNEGRPTLESSSNDSIPSSPELLASQRRQTGSPISSQKLWSSENKVNTTQLSASSIPLLPPPDSMLFSMPSVHRPPLADISHTNNLKSPLAERRNTAHQQQYHRLLCTPSATPKNNNNNNNNINTGHASSSFPASSPFSVSRYPIESCLPLPPAPPSITKASALSSCSMTPGHFANGHHSGNGVQLPPPTQMLQQQQQRVCPAPPSSSSGSSSSSGMLSSPSGPLQQQQQQQQPNHSQASHPQLPPSPLSGYRYSGSITRPLFTNDENDILHSKGGSSYEKQQQQQQQFHNRSSRSGDYFSYPSNSHHQLPPPYPSYFVTPGGAQSTSMPAMSPFGSPSAIADIFQTPRHRQQIASSSFGGNPSLSPPATSVSPTHFSSSSSSVKNQHNNNNPTDHHHHGSWQRPITNI